MLLYHGDIDKKFQPSMNIFVDVKSFVISKLLFKKQGRCDKRTYRKMDGCSFAASPHTQWCITFTPALLSSLLASSGSNGAGMGRTGRSLVLIPLCCRDMWECRLLRDLATVPHSTHLVRKMLILKEYKWIKEINQTRSCNKK